MSCHNEYLDVIEPMKKRHVSQAKCDNSRTLKIRKLLVELATAYGRPITMVDDEPMVEILNMAANSDKKYSHRPN